MQEINADIVIENGGELVMPYKEVMIGRKIRGNPQFILTYETKYKTHRLEKVEWLTRRIRGDFIDYTVKTILQEESYYVK